MSTQAHATCVCNVYFTRACSTDRLLQPESGPRGVLTSFWEKWLTWLSYLNPCSLQSATLSIFFLSLSSEQTRFTAHCLWKSHLHADTGLKLWPNEPLQQMTDRSCCLQWRQRHHIYVSTSQETEIKFDSTLKVQINNSVAPCDLFCAGLLLLFFPLYSFLYWEFF